METPDHPPSEPLLGALEARVLGCLIEKELTTPEYYPLTLNSLVNACNQKSNRHPLIQTGEREVELALEGLRLKKLVSIVSEAGARVAKFRHTLDRVLPMETAARAVLAELLLRGAQTAAELRMRAARMLPETEALPVDEILTDLAERPSGPLVVQLERQPGQKGARWAQLLTGTPEPEAPAAARERGALTVTMTLPPEVEQRLATLETEVAELREELAKLKQELGAG